MQFLNVLTAVLALTSATPGYAGAGYIGGPAYHGGYASNLLTPSGDTVEVAAAKAAHFQAHAKARSGLGGYGVGAYGGPAYHGGYASGVLTPSGETVEVAAAKAAHFQAHAKARAGNGNVGYGGYGGYGVGAYGALGYGAGLPVAYGTGQIVDPVAIAAGAPLPVQDTYEVAAAKAAHFQAHANAKAGLYGR